MGSCIKVQNKPNTATSSHSQKNEPIIVNPKGKKKIPKLNLVENSLWQKRTKPSSFPDLSVLEQMKAPPELEAAGGEDISKRKKMLLQRRSTIDQVQILTNAKPRVSALHAVKDEQIKEITQRRSINMNVNNRRSSKERKSGHGNDLKYKETHKENIVNRV